MAKRTKGKARKTRARKKTVVRAGSAKRRMGKAAKKPRKRASKASPAQSTIARAVESLGDLGLLRAWSPSRYTTR